MPDTKPTHQRHFVNALQGSCKSTNDQIIPLSTDEVSTHGSCYINNTSHLKSNLSIIPQKFQIQFNSCFYIRNNLTASCVEGYNRFENANIVCEEGH